MSTLETWNELFSLTNESPEARSRLRAELEQEKARIYEQIGRYPTPIAGCDQQFNHLLAQQRRIIQALAQLDEAENEPNSIHHEAL